MRRAVGQRYQLKLFIVKLDLHFNWQFNWHFHFKLHLNLKKKKYSNDNQISRKPVHFALNMALMLQPTA